MDISAPSWVKIWHVVGARTFPVMILDRKDQLKIIPRRRNAAGGDFAPGPG